MVGFGFTMGVQILVARRYGEKNYAAIGPVFDNSFYFVGLYSLVMTVAVYFYGSFFLRLALTSDPVYEASSIFLKYRVLGLFFATSAMLFRSFYTGISFTKYLTIFSVMSILFSGVLGTANTNISLAIEAVILSAYLGFTWLIAVHLKLAIEWVWVAEYVYFTLIGHLSLWYLKKGNWRAKRI